MAKIEEKGLFSNDDLEIIQKHFHELIIKRAETGWNCVEFLKCENKNMPIISNEIISKKENCDEKSWFPVPGMYGGFAYKLISREGKPILESSSWSRVVGGSGQRHEITIDGCILLEEGFV